jgi:hypothetical protein
MQLYKRGVITAEDIHQKAGYLKEGISAGSVRPGIGEDFDQVLIKADQQAKQMKIKTKS